MLDFAVSDLNFNFGDDLFGAPPAAAETQGKGESKPAAPVTTAADPLASASNDAFDFSLDDLNELPASPPSEEATATSRPLLPSASPEEDEISGLFDFDEHTDAFVKRELEGAPDARILTDDDFDLSLAFQEIDENTDPFLKQPQPPNADGTLDLPVPKALAFDDDTAALPDLQLDDDAEITGLSDLFADQPAKQAEEGLAADLDFSIDLPDADLPVFDTDPQERPPARISFDDSPLLVEEVEEKDRVLSPDTPADAFANTSPATDEFSFGEDLFAGGDLLEQGPTTAETPSAGDSYLDELHFEDIEDPGGPTGDGAPPVGAGDVDVDFMDASELTDPEFAGSPSAQADFDLSTGDLFGDTSEPSLFLAERTMEDAGKVTGQASSPEGENLFAGGNIFGGSASAEGTVVPEGSGVGLRLDVDVDAGHHASDEAVGSDNEDEALSSKLVGEEEQHKKGNKKKGENDVEYDADAYYKKPKEISIPLLNITISRARFFIVSAIAMLLLATNSAAYVFFKLKSADGFSGYVLIAGKLERVVDVKARLLRAEYNALADQMVKDVTSFGYKGVAETTQKIKAKLSLSPKHERLTMLAIELETLLVVLSPFENSGKLPRIKMLLKDLPPATVAKNPKFGGYIAFLEGDYAKAATDLASQAKQKGAGLLSQYLLGLALMRGDKNDEAVKAFSALIQRFPSRYQGYLGYGVVQSLRGQVEDGRQSLVKAAQLSTSDCEPLLQLGIHFRRHNMGEKALDSLQRVIEKFSSLASPFQLGLAYREMSEIYLRRDNLADAVRELEKASSVDRYNPEHSSFLAQTLFDHFKYEAAAAAYKKAYEIQSTNLHYALGLARSYVYCDRLIDADKIVSDLLVKDGANVEAQYLKGLIYMRFDEGDEAFKRFTSVVAASPNHAAAHMSIGDYYAQFKNDLVQAKESYKKAVALSPENFWVLYQYGSFLFLSLGDTAQARGIVEQCIALKKNFSPAFNLLGEIFYKEKNFEVAFSNFKRAAELDPNNADALINIALIHKKEKFYDKAKEQLEAVLKAEPKNAEAMTLLTEADYLLDEKRAQNLATYIKRIDDAIKIDTENDYAHYLKGLFLEESKSIPEAIGEYGLAIGLNKIEPFYRYRLAGLLLKTGDYAKMQVELDAALAIYPSNTDFLYLKAQYLQGKNQPLEAIETLAAIHKLDPFNYRSLLDQGNLYKQLGRDRSAYDHLTKGIALFDTRFKNNPSVTLEDSILVCQACVDVGLLFADAHSDKALTWYGKALDLCPQWAVPHKFLGYYWKEQRSYKRAEKHFETYLSSQPRDAEQVRDELDFLRGM